LPRQGFASLRSAALRAPLTRWEAAARERK
jgi:hypothetical protein